MTSLPEDALQEVVDLLLKHSDLAGPRECSSFGRNDVTEIKSLDDDINLLESVLSLFKTCLIDRIVGMRRRRNLLLPIYRLPPEILGIIFGKVQEMVKETGKLRYEVLRGMAGVSFHWFSTILSTPSLWAGVDNKCGFDFINTIIKRSKGTQLHVELHGCANRILNSGNLRLLMSHVARWGSLKITSSRFHKLLQSMEDVQSMPNLRSFKISGVHESGNRVPEFILDRSKAPRLHSLSIVPFSFPFGAPALTSLRSLTFSPISDGLQLSSHQWQTLLCTSSQLEYIKAVSPTQHQWRDEPFDLFHALLPNLQKIVLRVIPAFITGALLSSLFLAPGTSSPYVHIWQLRVGTDSTSRAKVLFPPSSPPQSLLWRIRCMKWMTVRIPYDRRLVIEAGDQPGVRCLELQVSGDSKLASDVLVALISTDGLLSLESLIVCGAELFTGGGFIQTLPRIPKLRKLNIEHPGIHTDTGVCTNNLNELCHALSSPFSAGTGNEAGWPLPGLRDLGMVAWDVCELVLPLIRARYGISTSSPTNELPMYLEVLRLRNLSRGSRFLDVAADPVLVSRLHEILDKRGTKLEVFPRTGQEIRFHGLGFI